MKMLRRNGSFLNLRHEGVWANRIIDVLILNLCTRQSGQLHVPADLRSENNQLHTNLGGPHSWSDISENFFFFCRKSTSGSSSS